MTVRAASPAEDNPSLGLVLCADKNDAVVMYTLGPDQDKKVFSSRYKLHLLTEADLKAEILQELELARVRSWILIPLKNLL